METLHEIARWLHVDAGLLAFTSSMRRRHHPSEQPPLPKLST